MRLGSFVGITDELNERHSNAPLLEENCLFPHFALKNIKVLYIFKSNGEIRFLLLQCKNLLVLSCHIHRYGLAELKQIASADLLTYIRQKY